MQNELTFKPKTTRNKNYQIKKDVVERNQDFINKRNEKRERMMNDELRQLTFQPSLNISKSSKKVRPKDRDREEGDTFLLLDKTNKVMKDMRKPRN